MDWWQCRTELVAEVEADHGHGGFKYCAVERERDVDGRTEIERDEEAAHVSPVDIIRTHRNRLISFHSNF
jgi:hypothetical protein